MNVGIIDVDGHSGFPNLALMKLTRHHRQHGDNVEIYTPFGEYDIVYMSKVFSFTEEYGYTITNAKKIIKGGTGYDWSITLPDEIDRLQPDYSIYPQVDKKTAYGFLTRGCIRKCPWCIVPKKEGKIHPYMDVDEIAIEGRTNLVLMDNNVLGCDYGISQVEKIAERKYRVDFNQAMDARLVTDDLAKLLARVKWLNYIRFGCDTNAQIAPCERAIDLLHKYGYKGQVMLYTMLHGTLDECYERTGYWRQPKYLHKVYINPQPMLDLTSKVQHIPQWQKDMARWGIRAQIFTTTDFKEYIPRLGFKCKQYFDEQ